MSVNIFLDAGGVILDETSFEEKSAEIITKIIKGFNNDYTIENYWNDADEAVYRYVPKVYDYILYKHLGGKGDFTKSKAEYKETLKNAHLGFQLTHGIREFLAGLSGIYNIGILGQYGKDFRDYLESENLLLYFTYTEIQDNYPITKPDPRYFEAILKKDNCNPIESIMVGDRIDKDIIPAKMTGLKTIRIKTGLHRNQEPRIPEEIPDMTVKKITDISIESLRELMPAC